MPRPALDHLIGRTIDLITVPLHPSKEQWKVTVEGGIEVRNYDPDIPRPSETLIGSMIAVVNVSTGFHRMQLYRNQVEKVGVVVFRPGNYSIQYPDEGEYFSGVKEKHEPAIEDPSAERVAKE